MHSASFEERISSPSEIYDVLRRFGTRYVVVEHRPTDARVFKWVQEAVQTDEFGELYRIPLESTDPRLPNAWLGVYEYRHATEPAPGAVLDIKVPLARQQIDAPLRDLMNRRYLR
jgi:hypothetical protein